MSDHGFLRDEYPPSMEYPPCINLSDGTTTVSELLDHSDGVWHFFNKEE